MIIIFSEVYSGKLRRGLDDLFVFKIYLRPLPKGVQRILFFGGGQKEGRSPLGPQLKTPGMGSRGRNVSFP